eukprot:2973401-Rhodomonas_salina.1
MDRGRGRGREGAKERGREGERERGREGEREGEGEREDLDAPASLSAEDSGHVASHPGTNRSTDLSTAQPPRFVPGSETIRIRAQTSYALALYVNSGHRYRILADRRYASTGHGLGTDRTWTELYHTEQA